MVNHYKNFLFLSLSWFPFVIFIFCPSCFCEIGSDDHLKVSEMEEFFHTESGLSFLLLIAPPPPAVEDISNLVGALHLKIALSPTKKRRNCSNVVWNSGVHCSLCTYSKSKRSQSVWEFSSANHGWVFPSLRGSKSQTINRDFLSFNSCLTWLLLTKACYFLVVSNSLYPLNKELKNRSKR